MRKWFQAMIFDFDGVLADSVEVKTEAFRTMYEAYGKAVADEVVRFHRANGGRPRREKFRYYQSELLCMKPTETELDALEERFSLLVVDGVVAAPEIPGARAFLDHWSGAVPLFVDSASPDSELHYILSSRELSDYFEAAFGSERSKKNNLEAIIKENAFTPGNVLFFGDALSDLAAANACGTVFVGIDFNTTGIFDDCGAAIETFRDFNAVLNDPHFNRNNLN